jgi:spore coat protein U-like protein
MFSARSFNRWFLALAALMGVLWSPTAGAQCTVAATTFAFGNYDVFTATNLDSIGTLTINCAADATIRVTMGPSATSGTINSRQLRMASGTDRLNYNIFIDAARTVILGDGTTGGSAGTAFVRRGVPFVPRIYGRIPAGQDVGAGSYTDQVLVSITP